MCSRKAFVNSGGSSTKTRPQRRFIFGILAIVLIVGTFGFWYTAAVQCRYTSAGGPGVFSSPPPAGDCLLGQLPSLLLLLLIAIAAISTAMAVLVPLVRRWLPLPVALGLVSAIQLPLYGIFCGWAYPANGLSPVYLSTLAVVAGTGGALMAWSRGDISQSPPPPVARLSVGGALILGGGLQAYWFSTPVPTGENLLFVQPYSACVASFVPDVPLLCLALFLVATALVWLGLIGLRFGVISLVGGAIALITLGLTVSLAGPSFLAYSLAGPLVTFGVIVSWSGSVPEARRYFHTPRLPSRASST